MKLCYIPIKSGVYFVCRGECHRSTRICQEYPARQDENDVPHARHPVQNREDKGQTIEEASRRAMQGYL